MPNGHGRQKSAGGCSAAGGGAGQDRPLTGEGRIDEPLRGRRRWSGGGAFQRFSHRLDPRLQGASARTTALTVAREFYHVTTGATDG